MTWIENLFGNLPSTWALLVLIAGIGLSVLFVRGLIRLALRAFFIGLIGLAVLGVVYYVL